MRWYDMYLFFQAEDGIRDIGVTGVQTCALPILADDRPELVRRRARRFPAGGARAAPTFRKQRLQAPVSTLRQKASTRAFQSSGTSWNGWWDSSSMTSKRAPGISSATARHSSGRLVVSSPPASTR